MFSQPSDKSVHFSTLVFFATIFAFNLAQARAAAQTPAVRGEQSVVRVPSVSEPWAASVGRVKTPPAPMRWHIGHYTGFQEAKRQANARRRAMLSVVTAPQTGAEFPSTESPQPLSADSIGQSPVAGTPTGVVFDGPSESDTDEIPPDSQIAAGPNYVVVAINSLLGIYDKSGNRQGSFQNFSSFFSSLGITGDIFDPRIIYDQTDQRFILSAGEIDFTNLTNGHVLLAVSASSDPTGTWHKFAIDFMGHSVYNTENTFPDFPGLGLSQSAVYITSNQFAFTKTCLSTDVEGCYFSDAWIKVIGLPELLSGNPALNITAFTNVQTADAFPAFAIQPALTYGASSSEFLVAARFDSYSPTALNLFAIPTSGTPTLSTADVAVPAYQFPPDASQLGGNQAILTNDYRPLNALWASGSLFLGQNVFSVNSSGGPAMARWYQITLPDLASAGLVQSGDLTGDGEAYYPALSLMSNGTLGIAFTTSSPFQFASSAFTAREPSDTPGTTRSYSVYRAGTGPYDEPDGQNRWGDYSGISEDPNGGSLWMITEFAGAPDPHFGTAVTKFTAPPALTVSPSDLNFGIALVGQTSSPMTITVKNISGSSVTLGAAALGGPDSSDFSISSDGCSGQTIAANQTCAISLVLKPSVESTENAFLSIAYAGNEFIRVGMTGLGFVEALITFLPSSMSFPPTTVGKASPPQTFTLTNTGNISTTAFSLVISGPFTQTNNCTAPLAPGGKCQASVVFHPIVAGGDSGGLAVQWIAPGSPNATISGQGVASPAVVFCPSSLSFPSQTVNTSSAAQSVIVTNNGSKTLTISSLSVSTGYSQKNNCPGSLPPLESCVVSVTFSPTITGSVVGSLALIDDAPDSPQKYPLSGIGRTASAAFLGNSSAVTTSGMPAGLLTSALSPRSDVTRRATQKVNVANSPLSFEPNIGQFDPSVKFADRLSGKSIAIEGDGMVFELGPGLKSPAGRKLAWQHVPPNQRPPQHNRSEAFSYPAFVRMKLGGARPAVPVVGEDELSGRMNYFIGNDPRLWRTNVPTYAKVKIKGVYPGIDLIYYGNRGRLEYDFVVAPGVDPRLIRLKFNGQSNLRVDRVSGDLVISTPTSEARLRKPVAYQPEPDSTQGHGGSATAHGQSGSQHPIAGMYMFSAPNEVRFHIGKYDKSRPLIIDPVLSFSTYLGGTDLDAINGIAVDSSGNVYVTGTTYSPDFPVTPGSFQQSCVQSTGPCTYPYGSNAFVSKLSADGSTLIYSTFLGGGVSQYAAGNQGNAIAVDSAGDAFVGGITSSPNFPVTSGTFQTQCKTSPVGPCGSAFVAKLNPSGSALLYSTYLGGTPSGYFHFGGIELNGIAVDSTGDAYVAGGTISTDFPTTPNALEPTITTPISTAVGVSGPPTHGFLAEFNPSGSNLVYSTFLGGSTSDIINGVALDAGGNIYVAGTTVSVDFPTTPGAVQPGPYVLGQQSTNFGYAGFVLGFATKFDPTWKLLYSTYFSPSVIQALAVDSKGSAYLVGPSPYFAEVAPYTLGDFVAKIHPAGCAAIYSSFLPSATTDGTTIPTGIAVDKSGNAYVIESKGINTSLGGANWFNPLQTPTLGAAIVGEVDPAGTSFPFWTTLGGSVGEEPHAVTTDSQGNIYVAGQTESPDFPTTPGAYQSDCPTCGSDVGIFGSEHQAIGGFVTKISPGSLTGVVLTRSELTFPPAPAGLILDGQPQALGLLNSLTVPLTISSVTFSSSAFSLSSRTPSTCSGTLAPGAGCSVYVQFQPTLFGVQTGTLTITDSGPGSPRLVALNGSGAADFQMTTGINRVSVIKGTDIAQFTLYVSEVWGAPALSGNVTLTCTATSPATCNFNPPSVPVSGGYSTLIMSGLSSASGGALSFSVIGSMSGQTASLPLSIQIQDFSLAASQTTATVTPGQKATYSLSIAPSGGFNQTVGFVCGNTPALTSCLISPPSITLDGTNSSSATVTVTTNAPSSSLPMDRGPRSPLGIRFPFSPVWLLVLAVLMAILAGMRGRRRTAWLGLAVMVLLVGLWASCGGGGGGGSSGGGNGSPGTAPGVYTLTVTATSGSLSHTTTLTLNVQ